MWCECMWCESGIVVSLEKKEMHHGITQMAFKIDDELNERIKNTHAAHTFNPTLSPHILLILSMLIIMHTIFRWLTVFCCCWYCFCCCCWCYSFFYVSSCWTFNLRYSFDFCCCCSSFFHSCIHLNIKQSMHESKDKRWNRVYLCFQIFNLLSMNKSR